QPKDAAGCDLSVFRNYDDRWHRRVPQRFRAAEKNLRKAFTAEGAENAEETSKFNSSALSASSAVKAVLMPAILQSLCRILPSITPWSALLGQCESSSLPGRARRRGRRGFCRRHNYRD